MAALSFAACNKEGLPQNDATDLPSDEPVVETPVVLEPGVYPATVVAEPIMPDLAGTKAVFDNGAFAWEAGDAIACFQNFAALNSAETNVLTTMSTSGDGNFSGELPYTETESDGYSMNFVYPASVATEISSRYAGCVVIDFPDQQDGRIEKLGDYFFSTRAKVACSISEENEQMTISTNNVVFSSAVVGLKVSVPDEYNAEKIQVRGYRSNGSLRGIAGNGHINAYNRQLKGPYSNLSADVLTISHDDASLIKGDTYACILPFGQNESTSDVNKIEFKIVSEYGTYTFAKNVLELQRGTIYDLGTFPTSCVTPKFSFDENGAVVMTSSPAEAKIYYTKDGSDPSAAGATLYEGPVEITGDSQFKAVAICEGLGNSAVSEYTAAFGVTAPVLKINESGFLTVEAADGHTYTYSMTSGGSIPGDPVTPLPEDGVDLLITGSHNIKVKATNMKGETAVTNGYYRVVAAVGVQIDLAAGASNSVAMAPFTITNTSAIDYTFRISNNGWYFGGSSGSSAASNITKIQVGLKLQYPSVASLYVKEHAADKRVYLTYKGEAAAHGSSTTTWGEMWNSGSSCSAGDDFFFRLANGSILKGFGLLEQGFESFSPAAASVSNETPVPGQNVAY